MSGICGLFNLDDAPVAEPGLAAMTAMLERRGPERTSRWLDTSIGLGHTLLSTTPELLFEPQPLEHPGTGCVITADVRLDNREELFDALRIERPLELVGDAELILDSYLRWGEQCVDRLLGDFAFALWDPRERTLVCARDHFGMRSFYYHFIPGRRFVFASDARGILVVPQVPYRVNEGRIADFLVPQLEWIDYTSTFFEDVHRLPPGHRAVVTPTGMEITEYWRPEPVRAPGVVSDDDYREGFLDVLTQAVQSRLRAPSGTVGSMLSGGMDSGSVVAIAKDILASGNEAPLNTFSATKKKHSDCPEARAIQATVKMPSLSPTFVYLEDLGEYAEALISGNEEPFDGDAMLLKALYRAAHIQERRILLDGAGGDVVLSEGSYVARLLRKGRWVKAYREIAGENRFWGGGLFLTNSREYVPAAFVPEAVKQRFRERRHRQRVAGYLDSSLISRDFARQVDIGARFERMRETMPGGWTTDYATERCRMIRPSVTAGRERYARLAAAYQVEARDPFLDKRVVDFCSRLPGRIRMRDGWYKIILRDLMTGRVPEEVRWLRGKPHLGWRFSTEVTREALRRSTLSLTTLHEALAGYIDPAKLEDAWREFQNGSDTGSIHSAHVLSVWLRENAKQPVVPD